MQSAVVGQVIRPSNKARVARTRLGQAVIAGTCRWRVAPRTLPAVRNRCLRLKLAGFNRLRLAHGCCWRCWPGAATPGLLLPLAAERLRASMLRHIAQENFLPQLEVFLLECKRGSLHLEFVKNFHVKPLPQLHRLTVVCGSHLNPRSPTSQSNRLVRTLDAQKLTQAQISLRMSQPCAQIKQKVVKPRGLVKRTHRSRGYKQAVLYAIPPDRGIGSYDGERRMTTSTVPSI